MNGLRPNELRFKARLAIFKDYVRNIATWLDATKTPDADTVIDAKHTNLSELTT